jgi:cell division control protein 24
MVRVQQVGLAERQGSDQVSNSTGEHALAVFWRQQENPNEFESFVLHVRNNEQYLQWETAITKLMIADQERREMRERDRLSSGGMGSMSSGIGRRHISTASNFAATPASEGPSSLAGGYFERDAAGWDDDVGTPNTSASSTPYLSRRTLSQSGAPRGPDRYSNLSSRSSHDDPNGMLMAQWRSQQGFAAVPPMPVRTMSDASTFTEASFGNPSGLPRAGLGRGGVQTKLGRIMSEDLHSPSLASMPEVNEAGQEVLRNVPAEHGNARYGAAGGPGRLSNGANLAPSQPPNLRMRSASTPNVYQLPLMQPGQHTPPTPSPYGTSPQGYRLPTESEHSYNDPRYPDEAVHYGPDGSRIIDSRYNPSKSSLGTTEFDMKRSSNRSSRSTEVSDGSYSPKTPHEGLVPDSARIASSLGNSGDVSQIFGKQNVIVKVHVHSPNVSSSLMRAFCDLMLMVTFRLRF